MLAQIFRKSDPRRRWKGYWIYFYASEHLPPNKKPLDWIHLHFKGQTGEVELYLKAGYPNYRIVPQWGKVPAEVQTLMRKFVKDNYPDIIAKIKKDLKEKANIDWDGNF